MSAEWRAFWIAAAITAFATSCSFTIVPLIFEPGELPKTNIREIVEVIGAYTVVVAPFVIVAGGVVALPIVVALRRLRLISLPALLIGGVIAGPLSSALLLWGVFALDKTTPVLIRTSTIGVVPGLTAALVWWFLAERRQGASANA